MKYKEFNDYELLYMVRESDDNSKDILYKKYEPLLKSIAHEFYEQYKYYGYDYEDFLQEAIISFERAIINFDEAKEILFYTFVSVCVKRSLITFARTISNNKKNISNIYCNEIDANTFVDEKSNIDNIVLNNEIESKIKNILFDLSIEFGAVLELRMNGFNYREISILLDIPTSTIEYRLRKIRKKLKRYYN